MQNFSFILNTLLIVSVISCCRLNFLLLQQNTYVVYLAPLPLIAFWIWLIKTDNRIFGKFKLKRLLAQVLIFFSAVNFLWVVYVKKWDCYRIVTPKGVVETQTRIAKPFESAMNWVLSNTKKDDVIVMLPEGPLINFLTSRPTNTMYYHLIPNHIRAPGEDNIVADFSKRFP